MVAAFSDLMGMDKKTALRLASSFGGGMGRMRAVSYTHLDVYKRQVLILLYSVGVMPIYFLNVLQK